VADEHCGGRVVATGGGGYSVWRVVPRAWCLVWSALIGKTAPDRIPHAWLQRWQGESPELLLDRLRDEPDCHTPVPRRAEIEAMNRRTFDSLRRAALPLIRGWSMQF
jgi:acetoin utilization protein AcuC